MLDKSLGKFVKNISFTYPTQGKLVIDYRPIAVFIPGLVLLVIFALVIAICAFISLNTTTIIKTAISIIIFVNKIC